jgi:hypothetical protein
VYYRVSDSAFGLYLVMCGPHPHTHGPFNTQAPLREDHTNLPDIISRHPSTLYSARIQQGNTPQLCPTQRTR